MRILYAYTEVVDRAQLSRLVTCTRGRGTGREYLHFRTLHWTDTGLMAKDKSEKKKKHASDAVPAEAEEDVEMKVSSSYAFLEE
jgi:hypothetical protein